MRSKARSRTNWNTHKFFFFLIEGQDCPQRFWRVRPTGRQRTFARRLPGCVRSSHCAHQQPHWGQDTVQRPSERVVIVGFQTSVRVHQVRGYRIPFGGVWTRCLQFGLLCSSQLSGFCFLTLNHCSSRKNLLDWILSMCQSGPRDLQCVRGRTWDLFCWPKIPVLSRRLMTHDQFCFLVLLVASEHAEARLAC